LEKIVAFGLLSAFLGLYLREVFYTMARRLVDTITMPFTASSGGRFAVLKQLFDIARLIYSINKHIGKRIIDKNLGVIGCVSANEQIFIV